MGVADFQHRHMDGDTRSLRHGLNFQRKVAQRVQAADFAVVVGAGAERVGKDAVVLAEYVVFLPFKKVFREGSQQKVAEETLQAEQYQAGFAWNTACAGR